MCISLSLDCSSGEVFATIIKKTGSYASEESFTISADTGVVYTSPTLVNSQERVLETCLPATNTFTYTLTMKDSFGDSWTDGAWIAVKDINENTVLKYMMTELSTETVNFALYSPIHKNAAWRFSSNFQANWNQFSFDHNSWTEMTLGSTSQQAAGTQYFRKAFAGVTGMAAISAQFLYSHGIVAYINGVEIFRDNMPAGEPFQTTLASGSYTVADYHGVIRPSSDAESAQSVLAVELHFVDATSRAIDFNAFLSYNSGISSTNNCFVSPVTATATGSSYTNPLKAFDFTRNTGASLATSSLPKDLIVTFEGNVIPAVNGFRIWPQTIPLGAPSSFSIFGGDAPSTSSWSMIINPSGQVYESLKWRQWTYFADPTLYKAMKVTPATSTSSTTYLYEMQFLICNSQSETFQYGDDAYTFYVKYSEVDLRPSLYGASSCQVNPQPPSGITFNPTTCSFTGMATVASPMTTYAVTAMAGTKTATGSVSISFVECQGTLLRILRTYKGSAANEAFRIRNTQNDELLMEVPLGNSHATNVDWEEYLCVNVDRFDVTLDCSTNYWVSGSYIYVYAELANSEEELILKARHDGYQNNQNTYYLRRFEVGICEQWYYQMGAVPGNWYDDNTSGWAQAAKGSFPASSNQIQLYKKQFSVSDLNVVSGLILNLRYRYGCIVYLNGNEAFRNNIPAGDISTSTVASGSYLETLYHTVTLPGRFVNEDGSNPISLLKQGTNTIAIGLVAQSGQTISEFDATVRLMTNEPEGHLWALTGSISGITGSESNPFDGYYSNTISYSSCGDNYLTITLDNDRREWVNTVQIQNAYNGGTAGAAQFNLYGKNPNDADWTQLKQVTGLTYSLAGQKRSVYFINRTPYNQFKFENFATGSTSECSWKVQSLNLLATSVLTEPAPLTYASSTTIFKGIEMSELIPEGEGYYDYSISPALPQGLSIDSSDGWVSGTVTDTFAPITYTVTARKITGGTTTASFSLGCEVCTGGRSLMTVRIRADNYAHENSWKLFQGRGTTGTVLRSASKFPVANNYYYLDFCLTDGLYTFQGNDIYGDGWSIGTGYTLTADVGEMELDIEELWGSGSTTPRSVSTTFSTMFPFQVGYTDWKVYQGEYSVPDNWNTVAFDDSTWNTRKAAEIPNTNAVTTYIRKSFSLSGIDDYQVLNVRVKYTGGVAVYLNGNRVARFNLDSDFDSATEGSSLHDANTFSKFHIILATAGIEEGVNVIAFEIHRSSRSSSSDPIVFDATGVFGVETCSTVIDSYSAATSTNPTTGALADMMNLDPFTTATLPVTAGTFVEWTVENLEGSKWNSFNILGASDVATWMFELYGYYNDRDPRNRMTMISSTSALQGRTKPQVSVPVGLIGFRKIRYEVLQASGTTSVGSMFTAYCKASGAVCPRNGFYPSVAEGQISPGGCPNGYSGYSYRLCTGGVLGEVNNENCEYNAPSQIRYRQNRLVFVAGISATSGKPSYRNIVTHWYVDEGVELPAGMTLNENTGEISGTPTDVLSITTFTIYAENPGAASFVTIEISVRKGRCNAEGVFPLTNVGEVAEYPCSMQGSYVGTQKRACVLGESDGVWEKATGYCMAIGTIVIIIVLVILVIVIVVFFLMRTGRKTKAVGGVKGKKSKTVPKKGGKKKGVKI